MRCRPVAAINAAACAGTGVTGKFTLPPDPITVVDVDEDPAAGTGLLCPPTPAGLLDALQRAVTLHADKARLAAAQQRGMARDFSWASAAVAYENLYRDSL